MKLHKLLEFKSSEMYVKLGQHVRNPFGEILKFNASNIYPKYGHNLIEYYT